MKQIYKDRLLKVVDYIENSVLNKHFDLKAIVDDEDGCEGEKLIQKMQDLRKGKEISCKTAGCFAGWLPAVYPRQFKWCVIEGFCEEVGIKNTKTGETNNYAAREFFGLTPQQSGYLFLESNYNNATKYNVLKRIKAFVKNDGKIKRKDFIYEW